MNYWMFRVSNKWGNKTKRCFKENLVYCGWNIGLSKNDRQDILKRILGHPKWQLNLPKLKKMIL